MYLRTAQLSDATIIAHIQKVSWLDTYVGVIKEEDLLKVASIDKTKMWKRAVNSTISHVAMVVYNNLEVGFASWGPTRDKRRLTDMELYAIYFLKDYRGKGVGRKVIDEIKSHSQQSKLSVWVLKDNAFIGFYKAIGEVTALEEQIEIGNNLYTEVLCVI